MKITTDPRCPHHPTAELYVQMGSTLTWICAACRRPLGLASFTSEGPARWPRGRRPPALEMVWNACDFDWLMQQSERRRADRTVLQTHESPADASR